MSDQKSLESAAALLGLHVRTPQLIVRQATSALRLLLDEGASPDDSRCQALLQLANAARLHLLPLSNDAAANAPDTMARAVHVDISTATLAAAMGLHNTSTLNATAVGLASVTPPHPSTTAPSSSASLRLRVQPSLSNAAVNSLIGLVRADEQLGERSKRDAEERTSSLNARMQRARLSSRQATARRRRTLPDTPATAPTSRHTPTPTAQPNFPAPTFPFSTTPAPHRRHSVTFGDGVAVTPFADPALFPAPGLMPSPMHSSQHASERLALGNMDNVTPRASASMARFRARPVPIEKRQKGARGAVSNEKGVMNDAIGTPDDVMHAFMHAKNRPPQSAGDVADSQTRIRSVLAERERIVYRLMRQRRAELAAMPLGVTEQTRRKAIIEAKQLSLLDLQRVVRFRVCAEMKKMLSPAVQEDGAVPADNLSLLFRRRDPPVYSYMDGYPRITPFDGIPEMPPRHPTTIAQDSVRMAEFDLSRMAARKQQLKKEYVAKLMDHFEKFSKAAVERRNVRSRVLKGLERHFVEKKRIEDRRRKLERVERLKLLRSNDEQAYLNLLENTKNERLLQLVRQTDNYLMQIGAQVEQQRDADERVIGADAHDAFAEELGETGDVPLDAMRRRRDLYYTVTHAVQEEVGQPSIMVHGKLKGYQVEGLKWMVSLYNNHLNGILADEMGLGKTIQTISLITYLVEAKNNPGPFLIIVPLSTMGNWVRELNLWAPSLEKVEYKGDRATRRHLQRTQLTPRTFNVLLTTYEFTVKDQNILSQIPWQYIIIDEGHRMKNANCKLAMTLGVKYKSRNRLLLTGTPLQNNLTELWALLNFLLPSIFSSSDTFEAWFKQPFESTTLGDTAELEEEERLLVINRLHQVLRPFLLRRLKIDVESQLPQKVEHVIRCDMSSWQRAIYRQVTNRLGLSTGANNGSVRAFNNVLMQCKKVCNHPYLFYDVESVDHLPPDFLTRASGKFFVLQHMLPKLQLHGHRTLIFSQMTAALDLLEIFLSSIGIAYLRLDGSTRADERQELLNKYNEPDSPYFCFLLSTRAGGLGLNLQTADTVIIFDSDWNPMMDLQAQDRAHRIGQTRAVRVYRLICSGTVEVKILEQANRKLHVDAQVIQAGQFNNKSTETDRHQMLKDLLRQQNDEEDGVGDVPAMPELNQLIAREEGEVESYLKFDEERKTDGSFKCLLATEEELPEWVLKPDVEHKDAAERELELLNSHGRGRRKRKATLDLNMLTEEEWFKVAEGDLTVEEAFERRESRKRARRDAATRRAEEENSESRGGNDGVGEGGAYVAGSGNNSSSDGEGAGRTIKAAEKLAKVSGAKGSDDSGAGKGKDADKIVRQTVADYGFGSSDDDEIVPRAGRANGKVDGEKTALPAQGNGMVNNDAAPHVDRKEEMVNGLDRGKDRENTEAGGTCSENKNGEGREKVWLNLAVKAPNGISNGKTDNSGKRSSERKRRSSGKKRTRNQDGNGDTLVEGGSLMSGTRVKIRFSNPSKKRKCDSEEGREEERGEDDKRERNEAKSGILKIRIPARVGGSSMKTKVNKGAAVDCSSGGEHKESGGPTERYGMEESGGTNDAVVESANRKLKVDVGDDEGDGVEDGVRRSGRKRRKRVMGERDEVKEQGYTRKSKSRGIGSVIVKVKGKVKDAGMGNEAGASSAVEAGGGDADAIGNESGGESERGEGEGEGEEKRIPAKIRIRPKR